MRKERKNGHPDSDADNVRFAVPYDPAGGVLLSLDGTASVYSKGYRRKSQAAPVLQAIGGFMESSANQKGAVNQ